MTIETKEARLLMELSVALKEEMQNRLASESSLYPEEYGGYERKEEHDGRIAGMEEMIEFVSRFMQSRVDIFSADQELLNNREAMGKAFDKVMEITGYPYQVVFDMNAANVTAKLADEGYYWNTAVKEWAHYPILK